MALKDIRVTFYYADEDIFDKVKQWKTRERLVKWANEFYRRYDFKIDEFPIAYNEKLYKNIFCLSKANGFKANYSQSALFDAFKKVIEREIADYKREYEEFKANPPSNPTEYSSKEKDLQKKALELIDKQRTLNDYSSSINPSEFKFRQLLLKKMREIRVDTKKPRLVVIFCEFVNYLEIFFKDNTIAETFKKQDRVPALLLWNHIVPEKLEVFTAPIILIDINKMTKKFEYFEYVLAHEIVHAAGNTTLDNTGAPKNIMIYADAQGKAPTDVNLERTDKAKLEVAFFVV
jgi:hypothetical protein